MEFAQSLSTLSTGPWKGFYFRELRYMARLVIQLLCSLLTTSHHSLRIFKVFCASGNHQLLSSLCFCRLRSLPQDNHWELHPTLNFFIGWRITHEFLQQIPRYASGSRRVAPCQLAFSQLSTCLKKYHHSGRSLRLWLEGTAQPSTLPQRSKSNCFWRGVNPTANFTTVDNIRLLFLGNIKFGLIKFKSSLWQFGQRVFSTPRELLSHWSDQRLS